MTVPCPQCLRIVLAGGDSSPDYKYIDYEMKATIINQHIVQISNEISSLREKKGKSEETIRLTDGVLDSAHDFVVNLMLEKHLLYQHIVMEEDAKKKVKRDIKRRNKGLSNMEKATSDALVYVEKNNLIRWLSRVNRCLGRVADYKGKYKHAINYYKKAIKHAKFDPEVVKGGVPRELEYSAFLAHSYMMSGQVDKGLKLAKDTYRKFDKGVGTRLKKKDYPTWAIWKSGIPIRMIDGLIRLGKDFDKGKMVGWLDEAEELLSVPKGSKKWLGKVDFGFRKDEVTALRRILLSF